MSDEGDEWTTISIRKRRRDRFNNLKADCNEHGVPEMSADQFLKVLMDTLEAAENGYYDAGGGVDVDELATKLEDALDTASMADDPGTRVGGELVESLEEIQASVSTVEERTGRVERTLEDMGARR